MKNIFSKFILLLLLCVTGIGQAWGTLVEMTDAEVKKVLEGTGVMVYYGSANNWGFDTKIGLGTSETFGYYAETSSPLGSYEGDIWIKYGVCTTALSVGSSGTYYLSNDKDWVGKSINEGLVAGALYFTNGGWGDKTDDCGENVSRVNSATVSIPSTSQIVTDGNSISVTVTFTKGFRNLKKSGANRDLSMVFFAKDGSGKFWQVGSGDIDDTSTSPKEISYTLSGVAELPVGSYTIYGAMKDDQGLYIKATNTFSLTVSAETTYDITCYAGEYGSITARGTDISAGNNATVQVGATARTLVATAPFGCQFVAWEKTGSVSIADASSASTTMTATGTGTVTATWELIPAYLRGRMTIYDAARENKTHIASEEGGWDVESSTRISMDLDNTNHRFNLHTHMKPSELSASQTGGYQWFKIYYGSIYQPTNYDIQVTTAGTKYSASTPGSGSFRIDNAATNAYVVLYFDGSDVWFELEQRLQYDANGGTGSAPANINSYYATNATAITGTNAYTRTGYTFAGWKVNNAGETIAAGASVTMSADVTLYAQWEASTYTLTLYKNDGGATSTSATATYDATINVTPPTRTGYTFTGYWTTASGEGLQIIGTDGHFVNNKAGYTTTTGNKWQRTSDTDLYARWTANDYTVTLDVNGATSGSNQTVTAIYDAAMPTFCSDGETALSAPSKTGYTFGGYYANSNGTGTQYYTNALASANNWNQATNTSIYAKWTANQYTVTLDIDEANQGNIEGATLSQNVTFDGATTTVPNRPTAANGYALVGYYTEQLGEGTKVINADGTWIASVTGYTDGDKKWVHDGDVTLYAYYKNAAITNIAFTGSAVVAPSTSVTVTPTISPTPTGTTTVCWRVLYSNDNPLDPQPSFTPGEGSAVSFTSPADGGSYKVEAVLHVGSGCEGTELSTYVANFQVAAEHTVTVQYKDASGNTIQASGTVTGKPLEWTEITAPDIFGYTFDHWVAGDGITLSENGSSDLGDDESDKETIYIRAVYDGRLTAVYNKKKLIYLDLSETFSTSGKWSNPYAYFYTSDGFWDETNGAGAVGDACVGKGAMTNIEGTDIWYYDYGSVENFGNKLAFTWGDHLTATHFSGIDAIYRTDFSEGTPLYVPLVGQTPIEKNTPSAKYYNAGYWVTYQGEKTGYTLRIKNSSTHELIKEVPFTSETKRITMTAVTDLEASHTYEFEIMRDNGKYYKNVNQRNYSNRNDNWKYTEADNIGTILTTASGDYTFTLGYSDYNNDHDYQLRVNIKYPVATNDYRLIYKDDVHTGFKPSAVVVNKPGSTDIVSFFVRPNRNPILYKQTASVAGDGAITWTTTETNLITAAMKSAVITKDSVYNFNLVMDEGGNLSVGGVEAYTGNFYIRTDGANNKWDNYTNIDHMMTYSEYSEKNAGYSHYFMAFVENNTNVKFTIANDYSPCISDTLVQGSDAALMDASGFLYERANVRFMWNRHDNTLSRAYLAAAKDDGTRFLVLRANSATDMKDKDGNALINSANSGQAGYNHKAPDNSIQFVDNENWIYETTVKVKPSAYVKLYAHYHSADHYYKGVDNNTFDGSNAIQLMTGSGDPELVRVIYDFKTDRLVAAFEPSGNIDAIRAINADVMFIREHQGDIRQLTFSKGDGENMGAITAINTAYAVMRFSKWTLNNKSKEGGHAVLDPLLSRYERDLFYVSFPFRVSMNEVFGFGTYGKHWIIEYYDGEARAANGFWADTPTYWRYVTDRRNKFFEPNQGYIIALDLDELGEESDVWNNNVENVELYFPSYGTMPNITNSTVEYTLPEHTCTIGPRPGMSDDRTIKDSHWNVMSVPTYVNTSSVEFANTTWITKGDGRLGPSFLYEWNSNDNSLTARSGSGYTYHAMHAYMVQYYDKVTWSTSVSPASIVARERMAPSEVEFRLELSQDEQMFDQTFVRLSNDENASEGFVFGEDLSKEFNKNKANIYTFIGTEQAAGNTLPMMEQKTEVPVGVKIAADGDYTFAIPEGTAGVGVTLLDNEAGVRTSLSALDYTINLTAGTYNERFVLEISPIRPISTDLENTEYRIQNTDVRKVLIDNVLYIVKDGVMYDARGARVQ